jgi:hypothetical protein
VTVIEMVGQECPPSLPEPKLYVLVRRDLPWPVRAVQATHAAMQLVHGHSVDDWGTFGPAVVLLGVHDEQELAMWLDRLGSGAVGFREPDLCGSLTAIAYHGEPIASLACLRLM